MQVRVQFWGVMLRLAGTEHRSLMLDEGACVSDLQQLLQQDPAFVGTLERCAWAIGDELVRRDTVLRDGDEVSVLPPVSGG